jgi:hypothetical protein
MHQFFIAFAAAPLLLVSSMWMHFNPPQPTHNFGAVTPFTSAQLAAGAANGECLTTNGSANAWTSCSGGPGADTFAFPFTPVSYGNATSTTIGFTNGILVTGASSTFAGGSGAATTTFNQGVKITATAVAESASNSTSVGGIFTLTNTLNHGAGAVFFTNHAGSATGRLAVFRCGSLLFDQNCVHIEGQGTQSILNIAGAVNGLGVIKAAGLSGGASTNDSSILSLDSSVNSFQGQGLFIKHNAATSTAALNILDSASATMFKVDGNKLTTMIFASSTALSGTTLCIGTDCRTSWPSAAGSAFEIATTSDIAISQLAYINKTTGKTTLASVATTTLTGTAPITFSQPIAVIGGSASVITCAVATASVPGCLAAADFTTFTNKISWGAATSTSINQVVYTNPLGKLVSTATSSLTAGTGMGILNSALAYVIGSAPTFYQLSYLATSSQETNGQIAMFATTNGTPAGLRGMSTSSVTCSGGTVTCSNIFTTGTSPTITSAAWPFTPTTIFGTTNTSATSSAVQVTGGFSASSTVRFGNAAVMGQFIWDGANGKLGLSSSTPWGFLSLAPDGLAANIPAFVVGSTSPSYFLINNGGKVGISSSTPTNTFSIGTTGSTYGSIAVTENPVSTSTGITVDWKQGNQQLIRTGTSAFKIGFDKASTSGQTLKVVLCNPGSTAGAITWIAPIYWNSAPTQTTTANKCDVYSFIITQATSSSAGSRVIFGTQTTF